MCGTGPTLALSFFLWNEWVVPRMLRYYARVNSIGGWVNILLWQTQYLSITQAGPKWRTDMWKAAENPAFEVPYIALFIMSVIPTCVPLLFSCFLESVVDFTQTVSFLHVKNPR